MDPLSAYLLPNGIVDASLANYLLDTEPAMVVIPLCKDSSCGAIDGDDVRVLRQRTRQRIITHSRVCRRTDSRRTEAMHTIKPFDAPLP